MRLLMSGYVRVEYVQFEATSRIGQPAGGLSDRFSRFAMAKPLKQSGGAAPT